MNNAGEMCIRDRYNVALDGVVYQYDGNYPQDQNPLFILWVSGTDEASTAPRQSWQDVYKRQGSLSARRAWIEISVQCYLDAFQPSLSARRAWIEMLSVEPIPPCAGVALRKESVDRNSRSAASCCISWSRSPQGERG